MTGMRRPLRHASWPAAGRRPSCDLPGARAAIRGSRPGRSSASPSAIAAIVVTVPATPTSWSMSSERHLRCGASRARPARRQRPPRPARRSAGRRAGAARSSARSRRPCCARATRRRRRRRAPARSSRRRCRRPAAAAAHDAGSPRDRAGERQRRLLAAGDHLGIDARARRRTIATNSPRFVGVAGGAGRHHPHPLGAAVGGSPRRTRRARPGCARAPRGRAARCGRRPGRAGRCASARSTSTQARHRRRRRASATSSRIELVPQSIAATLTPRRRQPGRRSAVRTGPLPTTWAARQRLVAERVDARAGGQRMRDEHVQALHPVRHAARADAVDLGDAPELLAPARR